MTITFYRGFNKLKFIKEQTNHWRSSCNMLIASCFVSNTKAAYVNKKCLGDRRWLSHGIALQQCIPLCFQCFPHEKNSQRQAFTRVIHLARHSTAHRQTCMLWGTYLWRHHKHVLDIKPISSPGNCNCYVVKFKLSCWAVCGWMIMRLLDYSWHFQTSIP